MQRLSTTSPSFAHNDTNVFNVVVAYEDFEAGKQARRTYDYLVDNLGSDCQCKLEMWKFDVLGIPKLLDLATKDAVAGDIVIISTRGEDPLPESVQTWIESWLSAGTRAMALVALTDPSQAECSNWQVTCSYLRRIAKEARIEFFAQPDFWPAPFLRHDASRPKVDFLHALPSSSLESQRTSAQHWGINE